MRRTYTLFYMTPLLVAMNFASCQNRQTGSIQTKEAKNSSFVTDSAQSEKSIKSETETEEHKHFQELMNSVIKDDAAAFAHMTSYPIMRTYPMKWIEDSTDMVKFFPIMADDSLKSILKKTTPDMWDKWDGAATLSETESTSGTKAMLCQESTMSQGKRIPSESSSSIETWQPCIHP